MYGDGNRGVGGGKKGQHILQLPPEEKSRHFGVKPFGVEDERVPSQRGRWIPNLGGLRRAFA